MLLSSYAEFPFYTRDVESSAKISIELLQGLNAAAASFLYLGSG